MVAQTKNTSDFFITSITEPLRKLGKLKPAKKEKAINVSLLERVGNTLAKQAQATLSKKRLTDTPRRANMAHNIQSNARKELRLGKTILNLVEAIKTGKSQYLSAIRNKAQVELLERMLRSAKGNRSKQLKHCDWITDDREVEVLDLDYAKYPYPWITKHTFGEWIKLCEKVSGLNTFVLDLNLLFSLDLKKQDSEHLYFNNSEKLHLFRNVVQTLKASDHAGIKDMGDSLSYGSYDCETLQSLGICDLHTLIKALKEYFDYRSNQVEEDPVTRMERELIGMKIPNYFPTPKALVGKMLDLAKIEPGMKVLEPSAGGGHLCTEIRERVPNCHLSVIEINHHLKEILEAKGFNLVARDFLYHKGEYSRVVMNPPFQNGEDVEHIQYAYSLLSPGGRVVSIISEGAFFRDDKKSREFREWFDSVNGYQERLPDGSFSKGDRPTNVATRLIVVDKPSDDSNTNEVNAVTVESLSSVDDEPIDDSSSEISVEGLLDSLEENSSEITKLLLQIKETIGTTLCIEDKSLEISANAGSQIIDRTLHAHDYDNIKESFLEHEVNYETIIICPLSYSKKEIEHIYHAYYLLNAGGTLAVTLPETILTVTNKLYSEFHRWLRPLNPTTEPVFDGKCLVKVKKTTLF